MDTIGDCGTRIPEVTRELMELSKEISIMKDMVSVLRERISRIIKCYPSGGPEKTKEESLIVPLAAEIRTSKNQIVEIREMIRDMTDNCEL